MLGTCQNEDLVMALFGSVTEFAQVIEDYGDNFIMNNVEVIYDADRDVHVFYTV